MAGAWPRLFSVSMWVMAPISASQWAPSTWASSPIFSTCSSQPRRPRYPTFDSEFVAMTFIISLRSTGWTPSTGREPYFRRSDAAMGRGLTTNCGPGAKQNLERHRRNPGRYRIALPLVWAAAPATLRGVVLQNTAPSRRGPLFFGGPRTAYAGGSRWRARMGQGAARGLHRWRDRHHH